MVANVTPESVSPSEHNKIQFYLVQHTKLAASFRFCNWTTWTVRNCQQELDLILLLIMKIGYVTRTRIHTALSFSILCLPFFIEDFRTIFHALASIWCSLLCVFVRSTTCSMRMIRKWNGKHKNEIHFSFHFIFAVTRCVLTLLYVSNVLAC